MRASYWLVVPGSLVAIYTESKGLVSTHKESSLAILLGVSLNVDKVKMSWLQGSSFPKSILLKCE